MEDGGRNYGGTEGRRLTMEEGRWIYGATDLQADRYQVLSYAFYDIIQKNGDFATLTESQQITRDILCDIVTLYLQIVVPQGL